MIVSRSPWFNTASAAVATTFTRPTHCIFTPLLRLPLLARRAGHRISFKRKMWEANEEEGDKPVWKKVRLQCGREREARAISE